jgi:hypothetical protein
MHSAVTPCFRLPSEIPLRGQPGALTSDSYPVYVYASRSALGPCRGDFPSHSHLGGAVDWIERIFGVSPDGGSGLTEALVLGALCMTVVVMLSVRLFIGRVSRRRRADHE